MVRALGVGLVAALFLSLAAPPAAAQDKPADPPAPAWKADVDAAKADAMKPADTGWLLVSTALVMLMMPGLALFYGGMVRRKNVLGTMMHTMIALGIVGVQWVVCGYALAFGESKGGYIGWSPELVGLGAEAAIDGKFKTFPNTTLPLYLHAMFQGMFAIITVALVSGAFAERVKFGAYCLFCLLWTTLVYDPLAHWVWSFEWVKADPTAPVNAAAGWLGAKGAIDFAGGTVVHIAAGVSGLAAVLILRKRAGYGKQTFHPNSMVLTLLGAGLLWFGWFGFNGGSALFCNAQAVSALTVTQVAAATAGLAWVLVEWLHRGKPTALGFASGVVAGLVGITPASGFVAPGGALIIGVVTGIACYWVVTLKGKLKYDDSLDAFGIHGVGGILGAILTGALVNLPLWVYGSGMPVETFPGKLAEEGGKKVFDRSAQLQVQLLAVAAAAVYAFVVTAVLVLVIDKTIGFTLPAKEEAAGLDLSQHGEVGMDLGPDVDAGAVYVEPRAAAVPPNGHAGGKRFTVVVDGPSSSQLLDAWSKLCRAGDGPPSTAFTAVYPYLTTVTGNKFRFRGGDPAVMANEMQKLFTDTLGGGAVKAYVER